MAKAKPPPPPAASEEPIEVVDELDPIDEREQRIRSISCPYCKPIAFAQGEAPELGRIRWHHPKCGRPAGYDRPAPSEA